MIIKVDLIKVTILAVSIWLMAGCVPTMDIIAFKEPEPEYRGCQKVNKGQSFQQIKICESDDEYFFYLTKSPWLQFPKREYQKHIRYTIQTYLRSSGIEPTKIPGKKIELWIGSNLWDAKQVRLFAYVHPLIFRLPIRPGLNTLTSADISQIPKQFEKKFPEYLGVIAGHIDVELTKPGNFQAFQKNLSQSRPEIRVILRDQLTVRLEVPAFKLDHYAQSLSLNPGTSKLIRHIRYVNPELPARHYKLFTSFPF